MLHINGDYCNSLVVYVSCVTVCMSHVRVSTVAARGGGGGGGCVDLYLDRPSLNKREKRRVRHFISNFC